MDEKTAALIEKLADKFGTTAEHLWGVLVHQAPISSAVDLVKVVLLILSAVILAWFVKGKTTVPKTSEDGRPPRAEWDNDDSAMAWLITGVYILVIAMIAFASAQEIVAGFFNPEYWALSHLLGL